ncbi:MAG TPA: YsnF/AvaK domain-containing protein [Allosphingosinicella sp.]|nr:YsnF/AvaK domain-containing protein [Allosphingosinicella sp.]
MSRTVTALYDTRQEAEAARQRLASAVDAERVKIIDQSSGGGQDGRSLGNLYLSDDDRHAYGEGLRRGGFLLCAEVHSGEDHERIIQLLEETSSVDLEERQQSWKNEGWQAYSGGSTSSTSGASTSSTQTGIAAQSATTGQGATAAGNVVEEERIPIVEEELRIGKREVTRGGARVRSYVREVPVEEQVTLREEHVSVERRPVQQQQGVQSTQNAEDLLQDREIEMRETAEEAVVQKVANVREELVVRKTAEEHVEQVRDTVRHTEVEVDEGAQGSGDRSAFGNFGSGEDRAASTDSEKSDFERDRSR